MKKKITQFYVIRNYHTQRAIAPYAGFSTRKEAGDALATYKQAPVCDMHAYVSPGNWKDVYSILWEYYREKMGNNDHATLATMWATNKRLIALRALHEAVPFLREVIEDWGRSKSDEALDEWVCAGIITRDTEPCVWQIPEQGGKIYTHIVWRA